MKIPAHIDKARRLITLRQRLDPLADFEIWFWTTLTAGTNMLNATLHAAGLTTDDRAFSTIPGVHVVPQADGTYAYTLRGLGDVSHVGWPPIEGAVPACIRELEVALHAIEQHRDPCIRGYGVPTRAIVEECERAFGTVVSIFTRAIGEGRHESP